MKTIDVIIAESTEFVFEEIGRGAMGKILRFAPVTRFDGCVWIHPTYAREATFDDMKTRASIIWRVTSLWNTGTFKLAYKNYPARALRNLSK